MSKSQFVSERIMADLREGTFGQEGRLPPEVQLARRYETSRSTVREALSLLSYENLIDRRRKRGTHATISPNRNKRVLLALHNIQSVRSGDDYYYNRLFQGIREELGQDYDLDFVFKKSLLESPPSAAVGGVIFPLAEAREAEVVMRLAEGRVRLVAVNSSPRVEEVDSVCHDHLSAGVLAARHLAEAGCRRIAFVGLPEHRLSAWERYKGYRSVLLQRDLEVDPSLHLIVDDYGETHGYEAGRRILRMPRLPEGVCVASDYLLVGLMRALLEAGVEVPGQIRCIGYGDYPIARFYHPTLSTIRVDAVACGRQAAALLKRRMEAGGDDPVQRIEIPVELSVRESTAVRGSAIPRRDAV
jgi:DNA-binding LacI/PurR family transcriptional regulator